MAAFFLLVLPLTAQALLFDFSAQNEGGISSVSLDFTIATLTINFDAPEILSVTAESPAVRFQNVGLNGEGSTKAYAPIPEPATMLFLGASLIGLAGFGRKKILKKKKA